MEGYPPVGHFLVVSLAHEGLLVLQGILLLVALLLLQGILLWGILLQEVLLVVMGVLGAGSPLWVGWVWFA